MIETQLVTVCLEASL